MTSTLLNKGTNTGPVKSKMDQSKVPTEPTKEELRSFLSFSRENLSVSHSEIEQGFNKIRPRIRKDTILSLTAIFFALFCIGLEIWKIQSVVDNTRDIEILKHEVESMKHRLLEEELLDELKAFEEMYAEEDNEDDDTDGSNDNDGDYDSGYDDEDENDEHDEDSMLSSQEYPDDFHSIPYKARSWNSGSDDAVALTRELDLKNVLTAPNMPQMKSMGEKDGTIELERVLDEEKLSNREQLKNLAEEDKEGKAEEFSVETDETSTIKRKRSIDRKQPTDYSPGDSSINGRSFLHSNKRNSTGKLDGPRLSLYDSLMNGEEMTTEKSEEQPLIHHAMRTSWDKHPPKKYYVRSRPATSDAAPPLSYATGMHNSRKMNARRLRSWRDEGPQALTRKEETVNRKDGTAPKVMQEIRSLRRRGMTRRHLRGGRQIVAAHYGADSSLFSDGDEHIGNGKGRHYEGVFKAWRPSNWMGELGMSRHFTLSSDGRLTVQETGLYLIYAQIHYLDEHDENGFQILVNDRSILQCMVYSPGTEHKSRSCFSAQAALLQSEDRLLLKDVAMDRYTLFQHDKSFFGLVKIGDTRLSRQQQQN